jgi:hypothetical protein
MTRPTIAGIGPGSCPLPSWVRTAVVRRMEAAGNARQVGKSDQRRGNWHEKIVNHKPKTGGERDHVTATFV